MNVYGAGDLTEISTMPDVSTLPIIGTAYVSTIDFQSEWGAGYFRAVVPGTPDNLFAATWTGSFRISTAGNYMLCTNSDDGSTLSIDGTLVVDNGGLHAPLQMCASRLLAAGKHSLLADLFENFGQTAMQVYYSGPDTGNTLIPIQAA